MLEPPAWIVCLPVQLLGLALALWLRLLPLLLLLGVPVLAGMLIGRALRDRRAPPGPVQ